MTRLSRITSPRATIGAFVLLAAVMLTVGLLAEAADPNAAGALAIVADGAAPGRVLLCADSHDGQRHRT